MKTLRIALMALVALVTAGIAASGDAQTVLHTLRKLARIEAASAVLALVVMLGSGFLGGQGVSAQSTVNFDIDPEISGNTASTLGTVEECVRVDGSGGFDGSSDYTIDAVVQGDTQAPIAYDAWVTYDNTAINVVTADTLIKLPGALDSSDSVPDSDGQFSAGAMYIMGGPGTPGNGTILRMGLDINFSAGPTVVTFGFATAAYTSGAGSHPTTAGTAMLAINTDCPGLEVDLSVASDVPSPPTDLDASVTDFLHVDTTGTHTGAPLSDMVEVTISHTVTAPPDCTVDGGASASDSWTGDLEGGANHVLATDFTIHCSQPSTHIFVVDSQITLDEPGYVDPNLANNTDQESVYVDVWADSDVKIHSFEVIYDRLIDSNGDTVPDIAVVDVSTPTDVIVRKEVHNNGPSGPIEVELAKSASVLYGDAEVLPPTDSEQAILDASVTTVVDETFQIHCLDSNVGDVAVFLFHNDLTIKSVHGVDPDLGNNSADTSLTVLCVARFTPTFSETIDEDDGTMGNPVDDICIPGLLCKSLTSVAIPDDTPKQPLALIQTIYPAALDIANGTSITNGAIVGQSSFSVEAHIQGLTPGTCTVPIAGTATLYDACLTPAIEPTCGVDATGAALIPGPPSGLAFTHWAQQLDAIDSYISTVQYPGAVLWTHHVGIAAPGVLDMPVSVLVWNLGASGWLSIDVTGNPDNDLDGLWDDVNDPDDDNDTVPDVEDNCPLISNTLQEDGDGDDVGDACDPNPGVADPTDPETYVCSPYTSDTLSLGETQAPSGEILRTCDQAGTHTVTGILTREDTGETYTLYDPVTCASPVDLSVDSLVMTETTKVLHVQSRGTHTGGPSSDTVSAQVSHTVTAPVGCDVNGGGTASDSWTGDLAADESYALLTGFDIHCSETGTHTFAVESEIELLEPGYIDLVPENSTETINAEVEVWALADRDGDTVPDASDNCADDPNAGQEDNEGDHRGDVCDEDDDEDGYSDEVETYLGTDPMDRCPDGTDAWPLDNNMDTWVTVGGDVLPYRGRIGATGGPPADPEWLLRLDINMDNWITVGGDVLPFRGMIGEQCTDEPEKKKCGVESFAVEWTEGPDAGATEVQLRLDITIGLKDEDPFDPVCCEFKQNVQTVWEVTAGPHENSSWDTTPMHDDSYSRADDTDGNPELTDPTFTISKTPEIIGLGATDDIDFVFTGAQIVYAPGSATCEAQDPVATIGPYTATTCGEDPREYGDVPKDITSDLIEESSVPANNPATNTGGPLPAPAQTSAEPPVPRPMPAAPPSISPGAQGPAKNAPEGPGIGIEEDCQLCGMVDPNDPGDPIFLHSGESYSYVVDLEIPGRGFNWQFARRYRSGIIFDGPLGHNWEFNYNRRLIEDNAGNVIRMDGYGRADTYELQPDGSYQAPPGFYTSLTKNPDGSFSERDRQGVVVNYSAPWCTARMTSITDRDGNTMQFIHNDQGQLIQVIDTLGRPIDYTYDGDGHLTQVTDFIGRTITFQYDSNGDLVAVTSPSVTGTPNGNDFPDGKTTAYTYSSGFADARLNHNLLTITAPNEVAASGPPSVALEYGTTHCHPDLDRVTSLTLGGTNASGVPAGGTITYDYEILDPSPPDPVTSLFSKTTVTDRNGNLTEYEFNQLGNILTVREFTNRDVHPSDPDFFETQYEYNADSELLQVTYPEDNTSDRTFDDGDIGGGDFDRLQQGNQLEGLRTPDSRGGDQTSIKTTSTYEPIYNQVRTRTESRGNDPSFVPQNGGVTSPARYTTTYTFDYEESCDLAAIGAKIGRNAAETQQLLTDAGMCGAPLGDVNGDGVTDQVNGNVIRIEYPTANLLSGSNQAAIEGDTTQEIVELYTYNDFGQMLTMTDPEGNVDTYEYYPEQDPNGDTIIDNPSGDPTTGGYLKQTTRDTTSDPSRNSGTNPTPTNIRRLYEYDAVGNVTREVDGRGIATDYVVNELNQVVQIVRAADHDVFAPDPPEPDPLTDFQYLERIFYDANDNVVRRQVEDRGDTSGVGGDNGGSGTAFVDYVYEFDILDNQVEMIKEVSDSEDLVTRYRYDPNENQVLVIQPEGNAVSSVYDERDLLFQSTRGATSPPALVHLAGGDPIDYDVRGGAPSTMTYHYDENRNLIETVDAADTDGSTDNNSDLGGDGDRTRYIHDGFDRRTSVVDSVGNQTVYQYDPAGNVVRITRFGPVGGASPISDGPDLLPQPVSDGGVIQAGNLVSSNLLESTESLYDELSRVFQTDRALFVNTIATVRVPDVADGASDIGKGDLTPGDTCAVPGIAAPPSGYLGCVTTRTEYDRNSRSTFTVEDDEETYRIFYDGADRVIKTFDPESNTVETAYDDNDNDIETRETDVSQVAGVPDEVFVTTFFYDSLNRLQRSVDNIGRTLDYRYDSRDNLVAEADAQGPLMGASISRRAFSGGALTVNDINDFGNVTLYFFDGVNRRTRHDAFLTASGEGDGVNIGATLEGVKTTTPTPDPSQSADGLISVRYDWDQNSLQTSLTDDLGNQTQYTYDNLNRRLSDTKGISAPPNLADRDDPDTTITYEWDSDDNIVRLTDENGSITECDFDAINRPVSCAITRAAGVVGTTAMTYEYNGLSRMTGATDNNDPADGSDDSVITYAYDSLSRVIEEMQKIGGLSAKAVSSAWRAENLRSELTYPNDRALDYTYDDLDRLNTVKDSGAGQAIADYDYIGRWRVAERAYPINGTRMTYLNDTGTADVGYDGAGRTVQLRHLRSDDSLVVGFSHTYDRMNNKLEEDKLHDAANDEDYGYDSEYRLTDFDRNAGGAIAPLHSNWTLDGTGNWEQVDAETRQHSSFNEIIERNDGGVTPILSDDNGNEIDDGTYTFEWDSKNRLRTVTRKSDGLPVAVYSYDPDDRRIRKVVTNSGALNGTSDFYYAGWQVVEERNAVIDVARQQYVYGGYVDEPMLLDVDETANGVTTDPGDMRLFYHQNSMTSVFALTDTAADIAEGYQYDAYGRQTVYEPGGNGAVDFGGDDVITTGGVSGQENPYMFTGRRLDGETALYYYRARYLNTEQGRFIARDPRARDALGSHYAYVLNSPPNAVDPAGTKRISMTFAEYDDGYYGICPVRDTVQWAMTADLDASYLNWCSLTAKDCDASVADGGSVTEVELRGRLQSVGVQAAVEIEEEYLIVIGKIETGYYQKPYPGCCPWMLCATCKVPFLVVEKAGDKIKVVLEGQALVYKNVSSHRMKGYITLKLCPDCEYEAFVSYGFGSHTHPGWLSGSQYDSGEQELETDSDFDEGYRVKVWK